jgi:hypothetical protein
MTKVPAQPGMGKHRATERTIHLGKHRATERTIHQASRDGAHDLPSVARRSARSTKHRATERSIHLGFCWRFIYFVIGKMSRLHDLFRFNEHVA